MRKILVWTGRTILFIVLIVAVFIFWNLRDRHPGYEIDLSITGEKIPGQIQAGFAALPITPEIIDTWNDVNNDAKYSEKDGDTYNDNNNNGKFDAYWIAGFGQRRAANGVNDDVWARVIVLNDGQTRLALVSLDAIGFRHDDIVEVRKKIPADLQIDYTIISSTHTHESNDLIGIWGENWLKSGINKEHMNYIKEQIVAAISEAVNNLRPVRLRKTWARLKTFLSW